MPSVSNMPSDWRALCFGLDGIGSEGGGRVVSPLDIYELVPGKD